MLPNRNTQGSCSKRSQQPDAEAFLLTLELGVIFNWELLSRQIVTIGMYRKRNGWV